MLAMALKQSINSVAMRIAHDAGCSIGTATKWLKSKPVGAIYERALEQALHSAGLSDWHPDVRTVRNSEVA